jgi:hypothetical protein
MHHVDLLVTKHWSTHRDPARLLPWIWNANAVDKPLKSREFRRWREESGVTGALGSPASAGGTSPSTLHFKSIEIVASFTPSTSIVPW